MRSDPLPRTFSPNTMTTMKTPTVVSLLCLAVIATMSFPRVLGWSPASIIRSPSSSPSSIDSSRRTFFREAAFSVVAPIVAATTTTASSLVGASQPANAVDEGESTTKTTPKVLVLGGTGFVGSRVVRNLRNHGIPVVATSRDGRDDTVAFDVMTSSSNDNSVMSEGGTKNDGVAVVQSIRSLMAGQGFTAVVSCIGAIGTSDEVRQVNAATGWAAQAARTAGIPRFVYVSVSPEVKNAATGVDFLQNYMDGKNFSQNEILANFQAPGASTIIEPTFIFGGDAFSLNPPRVANFYGEFIEGILSSGPVRGITKILPEGILKIALEPPVSVEDVAAAACAGALGMSTVTELDSYDKIVKAAASLG